MNNATPRRLQNLGASQTWFARGLRFFLFALALAVPAKLPAFPLELILAPSADSREDSRIKGALIRHGALESLGAYSWHAEGHRGQGTKIAILDSSFAGFKALRGKTLPERLTVKSFRKDGLMEARGNDHGTQCAEVVHAAAPEAELLLVNWEPDSPQKFLEAVRWIRRQGAQIISCSVIVPSWSDGEGGGSVHRDLAKVLGTGNNFDDVLFFASAGNTAERHWSGEFRPGTRGWHVWTGNQTTNKITPWGGERVSVDLTCPSEGRYDMVVRDLNTREVVGRGKRVSGSDRFCATVRFMPQDGHSYGVSVKEIEPSPSGFHICILGGSLQHSTRKGSIPFPADGPRVIAVGAVDENGKRQHYSSCGPNRAGPKPNLAAVVPFLLPHRPEPFTGTSAAAPQAAAAAALLWSRHDEFSPAEVREALYSNARHGAGGKGHTFETGFGAVRLPHVRTVAEPLIPAAVGAR